MVGGAEEASPRLTLAHEVGRAAAEVGAILVSGGRGGVMEAACAGAEAAGGVTIGILPGDDRSEANPHVHIALPTGLGELRNGLVVRAADVVIAIGGEFGTLSEIALARKLGKPVVALDSWGLRPPDGGDDGIHRASGATEAVELAVRLIAR